MDGIEFYEFLRKTYSQNGEPLYGNFTFCDWLYKSRNGTYSFRFNIVNNSPKAIPRDIITAAWDANQKISDNWIEENFDLRFHDDCRLHLLNFLLNEYQYLR
ncbi:MAG: hypothetical protein K9G40_09010 [Crocinitomicaceae bacterium]|nr:hypothetical protein [Crocinitomicaceae bacterium]MCF8434015.1 hypothetical protein [Crocinitomicaceae bacterium]